MRAPLWNETNKSQSQQKRRQVRRVLLAGWTMSETLLRMVWWRLDEALNAPTMTRGQTGSPCCVLHTIGDTKEANHSNDSAHFDNTRRRATWFKYSLDNNETIWNITAAGRCWTLLDAVGTWWDCSTIQTDQIFTFNSYVNSCHGHRSSFFRDSATSAGLCRIPRQRPPQRRRNQPRTANFDL